MIRITLPDRSVWNAIDCACVFREGMPIPARDPGVPLPEVELHLGQVVTWLLAARGRPISGEVPLAHRFGELAGLRDHADMVVRATGYDRKLSDGRSVRLWRGGQVYAMVGPCDVGVGYRVQGGSFPLWVSP